MQIPFAPPPPELAPEPGAPLHLVIEATRLAREVRGIGRYVRALLPRMLALRPGLRVTLLTRARDVRRVGAGLDALGPARARVEVRAVTAMRHTPGDLLWYPWNIALPRPPRGAVVVVTIHDVAPIVHPDPRAHRALKNWKWRRRYALTARRATLLLTVSRFTRDEVHRVLDVPLRRLRATPLAADDGVGTADAGADDTETLARLGVRRPFVLAVGAAERRKNLVLLERAMPQVVARAPELTLALAGPRRAASAPEPAWRRTLGFVTADELATLYRTAACLVIPSRYEGFGLPVLEAMRLGTPVICTRASSLPEVGGDAATYVDPDDDAGLADAIVRVCTDPELRATMVAAGRAWSARFSWDDTARQTLAAFDDAVAMAQAAPAARDGVRQALGTALRAHLGRLGHGATELARERR